MFKSLKLGRKGSSSSGGGSGGGGGGAGGLGLGASPPRLVPDAARAAAQQESKGSSSGGGGSGFGSALGIRRSTSGSGLRSATLVRPSPSRPQFGAGTAAAAAAPTAAPLAGAAAPTATAVAAPSKMPGVGTGPLYLTVKPDCLVLRAPASPQTATTRQSTDAVLVLQAGTPARGKTLGQAVEEGDVLGYEEETQVMAVLGLIDLLSGPYLLTVDAAEPVGTLPPLAGARTGPSTIYKARRLGVRPVSSRQAAQLKRAGGWRAVDEARYLRLLRAQVVAGALHFAVAATPTTATATATATLLHRRVALQEAAAGAAGEGQQAQAAGSPLAGAGAGEFVWNAHLLSGLEDPALRAQWGTPCISGFAASTPAPVALGSEGKAVTLTLVSRRSTRMQGTRFFRRGANAQGDVANHVETELIVSVFSPSVSSSATVPVAVLAHVQVRGSVPLPWAQTPTLAWQPPVTWEAAVPGAQGQGQGAGRRAGCGKHLERLRQGYGGPVAAVNLIDSCGASAHSQAQAELGVAFMEAVAGHAAFAATEEAAAQVGAGKAPLTYTWFDFHKECAKMRWGKLEELVKHLAPLLVAQGWTQEQPQPQQAQGPMQGPTNRAQQQRGVVRTNCVDNLDRTNVVQSLLARRVLAQALGATATGPAAAPALDRAFKQLWVANADALSRSYAGTPALKTDFVLTGRRTWAGMLADGANALTRYYVNHFWDGARQDAVAIWLGDFRPAAAAAAGSSKGASGGGGRKSPFGPYYRLPAAPGGLLFTVSRGVQELAPAQLTLQAGSLLVETAWALARALLPFLPADALLLRLLLAYAMWLLLWAALLECALTLGPVATLRALRRESWRLTDRPALASLTGRPAAHGRPRGGSTGARK